MDIPIHRRLLYALVTLLAFLALLEGALALLPLVWTRAVQPEGVGVGQAILCVGDSVTLGEGLGFGKAWPAQLDRQLEARGLPDIAVHNYAREGATGGRIDRRVDDHLAQLRQGGAGDAPGPVVLLMLGHNDFVWWVSRKRTRGDIRSKLRDNTQRSAGVSTSSPTPRLLRVLRWAWGAARQDLPVHELEPRRVQDLERGLARMRSQAEDLGGSAYVLTYLVPGEPPTGVHPYAAEVIRATRVNQPVINDALRELGARVGLPVIDLASLVSTPPGWDPAWFQDHIHLSAHGSAKVAEAVRRYLGLTGDLPPAALEELPGNEGA